MDSEIGTWAHVGPSAFVSRVNFFVEMGAIEPEGESIARQRAQE